MADSTILLFIHIFRPIFYRATTVSCPVISACQEGLTALYVGYRVIAEFTVSRSIIRERVVWMWLARGDRVQNRTLSASAASLYRF